MKIGSWLRDTRLDVWAQFAADMGGSWNNPVQGETPMVEVPHARGPVRIEGQVQMMMIGKILVPVLSTRISALLPATRLQRFSITRASFATSVAKWFGALDVQVDDAQFDEAFVVKGETPDLVRALFADPQLRAQYLRDFEGELHRRDDAGVFSDPTPDADPFELIVSGYVEELPRLRALYDLFVATLVRLPDAPAGTPHTP
jgi:hypothetical protein